MFQNVRTLIELRRHCCFAMTWPLVLFILSELFKVPAPRTVILTPLPLDVPIFFQWSSFSVSPRQLIFVYSVYEATNLLALSCFVLLAVLLYFYPLFQRLNRLQFVCVTKSSLCCFLLLLDSV